MELEKLSRKDNEIMSNRLNEIQTTFENCPDCMHRLTVIKGIGDRVSVATHGTEVVFVCSNCKHELKATMQLKTIHHWTVERNQK